MRGSGAPNFQVSNPIRPLLGRSQSGELSPRVRCQLISELIPRLAFPSGIVFNTEDKGVSAPGLVTLCNPVIHGFQGSLRLMLLHVKEWNERAYLEHVLLKAHRLYKVTFQTDSSHLLPHKGEQVELN